jgi:hypothetical protein
VSITIEEGKTYRSRDGQKVGPMVVSIGAPDVMEFRCPAGWWAVYKDTGRCNLTHEADMSGDLVAEWVDEPITSADIKTTIADEAKRIVSGARRSAYGKPEDNFERIARFWDAYFKNTGRDIAITAADVSPLMRLMKEARLCETPNHYDSHVDMVGYTLTGSEVNGVLPPS